MLAHGTVEASMLGIIVSRDRQERSVFMRGRIRLAATSVGKEQSEYELGADNTRRDPADFVVRVVLVEVWCLVVIDNPEEDAESVEAQKEELRRKSEP